MDPHGAENEFQTVHDRHVVVGADQIRLDLGQQVQGVATILGAGHHLHVRGQGKDLFQQIQLGGRVVDQHDPERASDGNPFSDGHG